MKNVKSYARFLEVFSILIVMPLASLSFIFRWLLPASTITHHAYASDAGIFYALNLSPLPIASLPLELRALGASIDAISFGLFFWGAFLFIKLLRCYRQGEIFSANTLFLFNKISRVAFAWTLYSPVKFTLLNLILTLQNPVGQRELAIAFSSNDVINIFTVGFFLILTSLMHEGYMLKHEQDLTV